MSDSTVLTLVAIVIGGGIVAAIAYHIMRAMKGSLELNLTRTAFQPGETIAGNLALTTKQLVEGNKLAVALVGVQQTRYYEDGKSRTRSHEFYRDEETIEQAREYPAGHEDSFSFELTTPDRDRRDFSESTLGKTLSAALSMLQQKETRLVWTVEARLDAKGIDLADSQRVTVNVT